jgi:GNAT superfamily N-acetyltransferase
LHLTFRIVDNTEIREAFDWHRAFAEAHDAIYPRDRNTFGDLVYDRCVWCAVCPDGAIKAMSYAAFSHDEWEIGGLMVHDEMRGKGLGRVMMRLPLVHMLVNEQPFASEPQPLIVAHVLRGNDAPRRIIPEVGFEFAKAVEIDSLYLPGLKADEDGMVRGDEFHFPMPSGLIKLADWCESWDGTLADGSDSTVDFLGGLTLRDYGGALREAAQQMSC